MEVGKTQPNVAHLSGGFMITSIVGFLISSVYVYPVSKTWGFTFAIFFTVMFIAATISMTYGPDESMKHIGDRRKK